MPILSAALRKDFLSVGSGSVTMEVPVSLSRLPLKLLLNLAIWKPLVVVLTLP